MGRPPVPSVSYTHGRVPQKRNHADPHSCVAHHPATHDLPLSRCTLWRWLHRDAIRPWYHRSWIFPRDPNFAEKAGRLLDLYAREWQGKPLKDDEFVISADEKTSIQARRRKHATRALTPNDFPDLNTVFRSGKSL